MVWVGRVYPVGVSSCDMACAELFWCLMDNIHGVTYALVNASNSSSFGDVSTLLAKYFRDIVMGERERLPQGAKFVSEVVILWADIGKEGQGKQSSSPPLKSVLIPNEDLDIAISQEDVKLSKTAIFFAAMDPEKVPARKYMDEWFKNVWEKKLGFHFYYCRMVQKGLFVIFFNNPTSQQEIVNKEFWTVGRVTFRALAWHPEALEEEVLALSSPRWLIIKHVPPHLWKFVPLMLEPFGKVFKTDETKSPLPHSDARVLVSLTPGMDLPQILEIKLKSGSITCTLETLRGLNACYLCHREVHIRRNCPLIKRKNNKANANGGNRVNKMSQGWPFPKDK